MTSPSRLSILLVGGAMNPMYEPAIARALEELGHGVEVVDASPGRRRELLARIEDRLLVGPQINAMRARVLERARALSPDFVLVYQGHVLDARTIRKLGRISFVSGIHNDDPFGPRGKLLRYRLLRPSLPEYDGFHVYREVNLPEARAMGVRRAAVLMPYYIPWLDFPRELPTAEQDVWSSDVVFAGHFEPDDRAACLAAAARAGFRTRVFGPTRFWSRGLPEDVRAATGDIRPLEAEDYRKALAGSRICTCFFSKWNRDQYTRRVFEITAGGGFLLSERTDFMRTFFREDEEVALFSGPEEFLDKVKFYLRNEGARQRVARAGRMKVLRSGCDVQSRVSALLQDLLDWRADKVRAAGVQPQIA